MRRLLAFALEWCPGRAAPPARLSDERPSTATDSPRLEAVPSWGNWSAAMLRSVLHRRDRLGLSREGVQNRE